MTAGTLGAYPGPGKSVRIARALQPPQNRLRCRAQDIGIFITVRFCSHGFGCRAGRYRRFCRLQNLPFWSDGIGWRNSGSVSGRLRYGFYDRFRCNIRRKRGGLHGFKKQRHRNGRQDKRRQPALRIQKQDGKEAMHQDRRCNGRNRMSPCPEPRRHQDTV